MRAPRYPIATRVLWRRSGQEAWLTGTSLNASRSGVCFETNDPAPIGTDVEMILALSWDAASLAPMANVADVVCEGSIVRMAEGRLGGATALAATINSYALIRQP
jgi:hypothetical protein